jgi:hypothetical protein
MSLTHGNSDRPKERAAGFVADRIARGFTACYARPPGLLQHLTHGL